ncbi:hypothetical protein MLM_3113 [Mycobacterium lepraemurium]|nr:hypothetical protein MLM_3113 [Mycobacterium lepraemurium]
MPKTTTSPDDSSDDVAEAVGRLTEALETTERARGHLYSFHQLTGRADLQLDAAVSRLRELGHTDLAEHISRELVGRNVLCRGGGAFRSSRTTTTATTAVSKRSSSWCAAGSPTDSGTVTRRR